MRKAIYVLFVALFIHGFETKAQFMPRVVHLSIDFFAVAITLLILLRLVMRRRAAMEGRYLYLSALFLVSLAFGVLLNWVRVEPLLVGMRSHLKYLPFFLLPMVYEVSGVELKRQLLFILPLLFLQLPVSLFQKFLLYRGLHADFVTGTLGIGSHVSMVLICSIAVLFGFYLKGKMALKVFLGSTIWLLLSTTINETRSAVVLLIVALVMPAYFMPRTWASVKTKKLFTVSVIGVLLVSTFALVFQQVEGYGISDVYEREIEGRGHLYAGRVGTSLREQDVGRIDALLFALKDQSKDLGALIFGLGCGNVIRASGGISGDYTQSKHRYQGEMLSLTHMLWELGLVGVFLYLGILFCLFRDALFLAKASDVFGSLALGWTAVIPIISIGLIYKNIMWFSALYVLFWYFSGVIAARAFRLRELCDVHGELVTDHRGFLRSEYLRMVPLERRWEAAR